MYIYMTLDFRNLTSTYRYTWFTLDLLYKTYIYTNSFNVLTCTSVFQEKIIYFVKFFLQDFIRAAMTCINYFYQGGANSYLDLYTRISYLHTALRHMQSYLDPSEWGSVRRPTMSEESNFSTSGQSSDPVRLTQSPEDVSRSAFLIYDHLNFWCRETYMLGI